MLRKPTILRFFKYQMAHTGENVMHVLYLSATVIEGHGVHALFAGGVVFFIAIGKFMHVGHVEG